MKNFHIAVAVLWLLASMITQLGLHKTNQAIFCILVAIFFKLPYEKD